MYDTYFGLKENPFNLTPDPKYLFLSHSHNEAFDHLLYGINERKGFIVIVGGIGIGKTTLCRSLLNQADDSTKTALIFNTCISETELIEAVNQEFGINNGSKKTGRKEQIDRLNEFLLKNFSDGGNAVLVFDEAQNLSPSVLEQIRMLSNLETEKEKLLQIVLVGQPELRGLLAAPALRQLNDRITVWYQLENLDRQEMQSYVEHRLVVAGSHGNIKFTNSALNAIHDYSHGTPRRINSVCDRALLIAYCRNEMVISKDTVLRAINDIDGEFSGEFNNENSQRGFNPKWLPNRIAPAAAMLIALILVSFVGWQFREDISGLFSGIEIAAVAQNKSLVRRPVVPEKTHLIQNKSLEHKPLQVQNESVTAQQRAASLTLDDRASLAGLFKLFNVEAAEGSFATGDVYPGLFSFEAPPQLYRMFRKPLRLRIRTESTDQANYLLIREITTDGAIVLDADGAERPVTEDYILAHWDREMSWVYPCELENRRLTEGMRGPSVLKVQQMLQQMGYSVEPTGLYDSATIEEVRRFQRILGVEANGIVGTRTKALLYQVAG
jgi:general secretion pathway protein A